MPSPFAGYEVDEALRPVARSLGFDLDQRLESIVALESKIPEDAFSAPRLGTERLGNGIVIGADGLVLTIGYLITEAEEVTLTTNDGRRIPAHPLGVDQPTGFGLVFPLERLAAPALPIGDSRTVRAGETLIAAGAGGRAHALSAQLLAREPFAGYWEYALDAALFTEPAHPHWNGAALLGAEGELVGVGSLRMEHLDSEGQVQPLNMFVPAELLPPILDDLAKGREASPPRPWLGVLSQEVAAHVVISEVTPDGPAARAELRSGDIVHRVAGQKVTDLSDFYSRVWALGGPGVVVPLTVQRERDVFEVEIRSGDRASRQRKPRFN
jgi:S1-C subfamily serine protease